MIEDVAAYQPWPSFAPHCAAKAAQSDAHPRARGRSRRRSASAGSRPGPVAVDPGQEERRAAETLLGASPPEDIAGAVVYLVGAGFVTGPTLVVDGGLLR